MNSKELKIIYREYFQEKIKSSNEYKKMFAEAVEYQNAVKYAYKVFQDIKS